MFGVPKGWWSLSSENREWWRRHESLSWLEKLQNAAFENRVDRISFLLTLQKFEKSKERISAIESSISGHAPDALSALFNLTDYWESGVSGRLFHLAALEGDIHTWQNLCNLFAKKTLYGYVGEAFGVICGLPEPEAFVDIFLNSRRSHYGASSDFETVLKVYGMSSTERLQYVLLWGKDHKQELVVDILNRALVTAATNHDVEKVKLLIEHGANPGALAYQVIDAAFATDDKAFLKMFMDIVPMHHYRLARCILADTSEAGVHTLVEEEVLPNQLTLTTIYNFKAGQQIVVVEKPDTHALAVTRTDFGDIGNQEYLEEKRQKLIAQGGQPDTISKIQKILIQKKT